QGRKHGDSPSSAGTANAVAARDSRALAQAYFRIGLTMKMVETQLPQPNDAAAGWAQNIQQDLAKVGAPNDLIQLASATENHLKMAPREGNGSVGERMRVLREHSDRFCNARPQVKSFQPAQAL